jgi:hypothetical protein
MNCPVCTSSMHDCFSAEVLGKYKAQYRACNTCGFLHATDPHWLKEAYTRAIASADTGLVRRNITLTNKISRIIYWLMPEHGKGIYLDIAGGYGMLTRMMRDLGFNFYWSDKYCENLIAPTFDYNQKLGTCSAVTAIEVLEHVIDPVSFFQETLEYSGASTILFTTELYSGEPPSPSKWWYYSFSTGQHISFFQARTMEIIAAKLGLKFYSANGVHLLTKNKINKLGLQVLTNRYLSLFPSFLIQFLLGSKTIEDHKNLMRDLTYRKNES